MKYAILIVLLLFATGADAQPGKIDNSFGDQTRVETDFYGRYDYISALALQSDGKILAGGISNIDFSGDTIDFAIARYNSDGSLDYSFGNGGKVIYHFGNGEYRCYSMLLQKDNKIVLGGYFMDNNSHAQILIVRLNSDGTVDYSFGVYGRIITNFLTRTYSTSYALQSDDKIVVSAAMGTNTDGINYNSVLIRFNKDGSFDETFGKSGVLTIDSTFFISSIAIQSNDKIITTGYCISDYCRWTHTTLLGFNSDGTSNKNFGNSGTTLTEYIASSDCNIQILKDDKILLCGSTIGKDTLPPFSDSLMILQYTSDGKTDSSFGVSGATLNKVVDYQIALYAVLIQPDGKIVCAGNILVRYNANGTLDNSFGVNGRIPIKEECISIAFQGNKIIAAGVSNYSKKDFLLRRYNFDGSLDNPFSSYTGIINVPSAGNDGATCLTIRYDYGLLLSGNSDLLSGGYLGGIAYDRFGNLEKSFALDGRQIFKENLILNSSAIWLDSWVLRAGQYFNPANFTLDFAIVYQDYHDSYYDFATINFGGHSSCRSVLVQRDNKIFLSGYAFNGRNYDFALAHYDLQGTGLDSSFGTNGKITTDIGENQDYAYASALQNDGKIILAGTTYNNKQWLVALVRYNSDGSLDNSFGSSGIVTTAIHDSDDCAKGIAIQSDGKIVVAGYTRLGSKYDFALLRYLSNGRLDSTFGTSGIIETRIGNGNAQCNGMVIESDGKIILGGYSSNGKDDDFTLACYNPDGSLDKNFGTNAITTTDYGFGDDHINAIALQSDGAIVAAGYAFNGTDRDYAVARYIPDLTLGVVNKRTSEKTIVIYPNPIHGKTKVNYELSESEHVTMKLFDILGNERAVFLNNEMRSEGKNTDEITLSKALFAGSYILVIETEKGRVSVKVVKE